MPNPTVTIETLEDGTVKTTSQWDNGDVDVNYDYPDGSSKTTNYPNGHNLEDLTTGESLVVTIRNTDDSTSVDTFGVPPSETFVDVDGTTTVWDTDGTVSRTSGDETDSWAANGTTSKTIGNTTDTWAVDGSGERVITNDSTTTETFDTSGNCTGLVITNGTTLTVSYDDPIAVNVSPPGLSYTDDGGGNLSWVGDDDAAITKGADGVITVTSTNGDVAVFYVDTSGNFTFGVDDSSFAWDVGGNPITQSDTPSENVDRYTEWGTNSVFCQESDGNNGEVRTWEWVMSGSSVVSLVYTVVSGDSTVITTYPSSGNITVVTKEFDVVQFTGTFSTSGTFLGSTPPPPNPPTVPVPPPNLPVPVPRVRPTLPTSPPEAAHAVPAPTKPTNRTGIGSIPESTAPEHLGD